MGFLKLNSVRVSVKRRVGVGARTGVRVSLFIKECCFRVTVRVILRMTLSLSQGETEQ